MLYPLSYGRMAVTWCVSRVDSVVESSRPSTALGLRRAQSSRTVSPSNGRVGQAPLLILVLEPRRQANRMMLSLLGDHPSRMDGHPWEPGFHMFMQWLKCAGWIA